MHAQRADRQRKWACADSRRPRATRCVAWLAALVLVARIVLAEPISRESATTTRTEHKIVVELTRKDTFVTLADTANIADTCVTLVRVDGLPFRYRLVPASGIVCTGQSVDIVLDKSPDVRIRLSMVTRGKERAVKVSPLIGLSEAYRSTSRWNVSSGQSGRCSDESRNCRDRSQHRGRSTSSSTPGWRRLVTSRSTWSRPPTFDKNSCSSEVLASQRELPFVQKRFTALCKTAELAQQIHGVTVIRFTVGPPVRREQ